MKFAQTIQTSLKESQINEPGNVLLGTARRLLEKLKDLQNSKDSNNQAKIVSALRRGLEVARKRDSSLPKNNQVLRQEFLKKYKFDINYHTNEVTFSIPKGSSVIELLYDAQAFSLITREKVAAYPPRLDAFSTDPNFSKIFTKETQYKVTPLVNGSNRKTRAEAKKHLDENGYRIAKPFELAAAHAAYTVFSREDFRDLFKGNVVRIAGTKFYYGDGGLSGMDESDYINNCRYERVFMAGVMTVSKKSKLSF